MFTVTLCDDYNQDAFTFRAVQESLGGKTRGRRDDKALDRFIIRPGIEKKRRFIDELRRKQTLF